MTLVVASNEVNDVLPGIREVVGLTLIYNFGYLDLDLITFETDYLNVLIQI